MYDTKIISPLLKAILQTDGSFTLLLSSLTDSEIFVELLEQSISFSDKESDFNLSPEERCMRRKVLLRDKNDKILVYAESTIALDRLPTSAANQLLTGNKPIGLILRDHKIPQYRDFDPWEYDEVSDDIGGYLGDKMAYIRTYTINSPSGFTTIQPIMRVTEYFAESLADLK